MSKLLNIPAWILVVIGLLTVSSSWAVGDVEEGSSEEESYAEEQVLQAAFRAFQNVDIFTESEIQLSREILFAAAAEGNEEAMTILSGLQSFADFYEKSPAKADKPLLEQVEIRKSGPAKKSIFRGLIAP